jgi:chromatin assembly factor 1 subunit A
VRIIDNFVYIGTWCKTSRLVTGRNPFGKDTCLLDYEYDSEADWNEEDGEGEDLEQGSDGGNDEGGDGMSSELGESDEDGWLVGDDDDIEMVDDGENHASNRALDFQVDEHQLVGKQNKKISGPTRRKIVGPLIPVVKGPIWEDTLGVVSTSIFGCFQIQMINSKLPFPRQMFLYRQRFLPNQSYELSDLIMVRRTNRIKPIHLSAKDDRQSY